MQQDNDKNAENEKDQGAPSDPGSETAPGEEEEEVPLAPEAQELLNTLGRLIDGGDKEAVQQFFVKLEVMNENLSAADLARERSDSIKERLVEFILTSGRRIWPRRFWLHRMITLDEQFLLTKAMLKATGQGLQLNFAGEKILDPPGEIKGRIYLPPTADNSLNADKLLLMLKEEYPARLQRLFQNRERLHDHQNQREGAS